MSNLSEKESFDNFLDHRDTLAQKYSIELNTTNKKKIYTSVVNELREKKLINKEFYENELETISFLGGDETFVDVMYMLLNIYICIFIVGVFVIIIKGEFKKLGDNSFNNSYYEYEEYEEL
jgi:hypothetical protein